MTTLLPSGENVNCREWLDEHADADPAPGAASVVPIHHARSRSGPTRKAQAARNARGPQAIDFTAPLAEQARAYLENEQSPRTKKTYCSQWKVFSTFCSQHGLAPLPASVETVAAYLTWRAQHAGASTLTVTLAALDDQHARAGHERPGRREEIKRLLRGIRRTIGTASAQKAPFTLDVLHEALACIPATLTGTRDRALLLLGFGGAFRRSEIAALTLADIAFVPQGIKVFVRSSKTDQEKHGRVVGIPYGRNPQTCTPTAIRKWLDDAGIYEGRLFRSVHGDKVGDSLTDQSIALLVKKACAAVGREPADFSGHSLRSGFCTSGARAGMDAARLMRQTGHVSINSLAIYIREVDVWRGNPAQELL